MIVLVLVLVLAVVAGAFFLGRWSDQTTPRSHSKSTSSLVLPAVTEDFTLLACSSGTTLGMEGCAEHKIVRMDERINVSQRRLFSLLQNTKARTTLIKAVNDWLSYRRSTCLVESEAYDGGSLGPVVFANCLVKLDDQRLVVLSGALADYGD
jgi:uncharacterized protein YecT (DUF1311 family)